MATGLPVNPIAQTDVPNLTEFNRGLNGIVYTGTYNGSRVAVKMPLDPSSKAQEDEIKKEAGLIRRIGRSTFFADYKGEGVRPHPSDTSKTCFALYIEFLEGPTLKERKGATPALTVPQKRKILKDCLGALAKLHSLGIHDAVDSLTPPPPAPNTSIAHGDFHYKNVLVIGNDAKVIDFGKAKENATDTNKNFDMFRFSCVAYWLFDYNITQASDPVFKPVYDQCGKGITPSAALAALATWN
ncbi:MAG: kinase-like domain-containing protein [Benniella sp.]|nr:MAG: kinase-like domain-containing protein [Benniella sp.]